MKMSSGYTSPHIVHNRLIPVCYLITGRLKYNYIDMFHLPCINQIQKYTECGKTPCPNFVR
jgi:hypothetical protein